jgi:hypothetical protein
MDTPKPNVVDELGLLHLHRPVLGASPAKVAAWHRERAVVLDHMGLELEAARARRRAAQLEPVEVKVVVA